MPGDLRPPRPFARDRAFTTAVAVVAAGGFALRLWAVERWYRALELGFTDNFFYNRQAEAIADGQGWIDPFVLEATGVAQPSAEHPPLYSAYLAIWSFLGLGSPSWHRVASCLLGVVTIVLVALVARRLAGAPAGVLAAVAAAVFPPLWIADGTLVAESLYASIIAGIMLVALRYADRPGPGPAVGLGALIALAALTRSEGLALLGFCALPLVLVTPRIDWGTRLRHLAAIGLACACLVAPWTIRNLQEFEEPTPLAYGAGYVMKIGSCDRTYYGEYLGYWHISCSYDGPTEPDRSAGEKQAREEALDYIEDNLDRVPVVAAARVGRLWHVFRPGQGVDWDIFYERRGHGASWAGLWMFYAFVPLAAAGVWALRRHRVALVVTGSMIFSATFSAAIAFGVTRYRIAGDVAFVVLVGVGADHLLRLVRGRRRADDPTEDVTKTSPSDTTTEGAPA